MTCFIVKFTGPFGFIKPWTAVRDSKTFSQQFLTASIVEGMEKKLFPENLLQTGIQKIIRHKLTYSSINVQQEVTQTRGWEYKKQSSLMVRNRSILERGVMINPELSIVFSNMDDATKAATQHICLCRNEDILFPNEHITELTDLEFDLLDGFELRFGNMEDAFITGYNRFNNAKAMFGKLEVTGNPVKNS